jgi:phospholipase C
VIIFGENISFDHYFATYPTAANPASTTPNTPATETPFKGTMPANGVNNLSTPLDPTNAFAALTTLALLTNNPNGPAGSGSATNGAVDGHLALREG